MGLQALGFALMMTVLVPLTSPRLISPITRLATTPIVDTRTHILTTFSMYKSKSIAGIRNTLWDLGQGVYHGRQVKSIVDIWCEARIEIAV